MMDGHRSAETAVAGFRIERLLGQGRCAQVHLAIDLKHGRKVALKTAHRRALARATGGADFSREFAALRGARHALVVAALDHGCDGDTAWLAMDAVGPALAIGPEGVAPRQAEALLAHAAGALAHVHAQGWVHRDLKPDNLLLRPDGALVLADFGCARRRGEGACEPGRVVGSLHYAAPEQGQGHAAAPEADVYSLGVLLHTLLTGRTPHTGETPAEVQARHLVAPVPRLPVAVAAWQPLLDAMLAKAPQERLCDGEAVLRALRRHEEETLEHQ